MLAARSLRPAALALWRTEWLKHERGAESVPSLRTFQRAFNRDLTRAERDTLLEGAAGQRRHRAWLAAEVEHRNHIWQADHKQLNVSVLAPGACRILPSNRG